MLSIMSYFHEWVSKWGYYAIITLIESVKVVYFFLLCGSQIPNVPPAVRWQKVTLFHFGKISFDSMPFHQQLSLRRPTVCDRWHVHDACVYSANGYLKAKVRWQLLGNSSIKAKEGLLSNTLFEGLALWKTAQWGSLSKVNREQKNAQKENNRFCVWEHSRRDQSELRVCLLLQQLHCFILSISCDLMKPSFWRVRLKEIHT